MEQSVILQEIDVQFADFICRLDGSDNDDLRAVAGRLSAAVGQGNICLDLAESFGAEKAADLAAVLRSTAMVGCPGEFKPLLLAAGNRLYLYRYWRYEHDLAESLLAMTADRPAVDLHALQSGLERLFGRSEGEPDWQKIAAATAVRSRFAVISGGPGTGKTSTVVKILALLLEQAGGETIRIALAAPTGKAAARLKDSLQAARGSLLLPVELAESFPEEAATIHRLLGVIPDSCRFRHDQCNQLPFEVVVIDEASMVPLPLMAKLVAALASQARLILLGDRDQLSSVDAGAVLGDICASGETHAYSGEFAAFTTAATGATLAPQQVAPAAPLLADAVVALQKNYRFGADSGIGAISRDINAGNGAAALESLRMERYPEIRLQDVPAPHELESRLAEVVVSGYSAYLAEKDPQAALDHFERFRVLCALRQGSFGVSGLNKSIENCLAARCLISPQKLWYQGRPVMITLNDYSRKLFNGDIGITLADADSAGELAVYFRGADGGVRKIAPHRLPAHDTVFAMTVHKSQGSEFDRLLLIMPPFDNQVLTREILYTGMTRARSSVELWCTDEVFLASVDRRITRSSGLRQMLWGTRE